MSSIKPYVLLILLAIITFSCATPDTHMNKQKTEVYSPSSKELYDSIARLDDVFFNAFNKRDLEQLKSFLSEDLEFYHDLGGVTNYSQNLEAFARTFASDRKVRRELVQNTLEVYPINKYGAVETGTHRFYATEKGKPEQLSSEAKFLQLWQKKDGEWKITRIVSYGHKENLSDNK
jgi:ketosteroid isomerase-like protein